MSDDIIITKEKLPQNITALVGEIGEKQVLLRLAILTHGTDWQVFRNLSEAGFDILLLNKETNERIPIEVKTRQRLFTTGNPNRPVHFLLSDGEYQACKFIVAYFLDNNGFFIIPKEELRSYKSNGKLRWRLTMTIPQLTDPHDKEFRDAWGNIHPDFRAAPKDL